MGTNPFDRGKIQDVRHSELQMEKTAFGADIGTHSTIVSGWLEYLPSPQWDQSNGLESSRLVQFYKFVLSHSFASFFFLVLPF
jgi:hypothetical protein